MTKGTKKTNRRLKKTVRKTLGTLFLISAIVVAAIPTAMRHSEGHVLTASVDNLTFLRSLRQHDIVVLIGRVTYVGNSSMEIRVDSYLEKIDGMRYPVNRAYLTLVALDEDNKPRRVPRLKLETVVEEAEWEDICWM